MLLEERLEELELQGFDKCSINEEEETIRVRCSQCEALVLNGVATHERGCPNACNWACGGAGDDCPTCYSEEDDDG